MGKIGNVPERIKNILKIENDVERSQAFFKLFDELGVTKFGIGADGGEAEKIRRIQEAARSYREHNLWILARRSWIIALISAIASVVSALAAWFAICNCR